LRIQETLARYSIAVDTGDVEGFASVFTDNGLWEWQAANLRFCGRFQLRRLAETVRTHANGAQHAVFNSLVRIDGDSAHSFCQFTTFLSKPEQIYTLMLGYYEDKLAKIEDKWLISHRAVRVENLEILSQGKIGEYFAPLADALSKMPQTSDEPNR